MFTFVSDWHVDRKGWGWYYAVARLVQSVRPIKTILAYRYLCVSKMIDRISDWSKFHLRNTDYDFRGLRTMRFGDNRELATIDGETGWVTFVDFNVAGRNIMRGRLDADMKVVEDTQKVRK